MKRSLPKKKLLVIDDDPAVLFAFRKLFGKSDFQVDTSESFDEAKKFIDKNIYQLIITDLGFSETINEAGIAISQYARKKIPGVKIILWTGMDLSRISEKARQAQIDLCLIKPVSPNLIQSLVENLRCI
ncbi:MAG: response regulator [Fibrobacter sp.]|jgi:DNA-binding NtrC family response regulator|nr:response regulator [Fibrobacter sp.]HON10712.1 response regulator [Chitinispirillaceae bacterium]